MKGVVINATHRLKTTQVGGIEWSGEAGSWGAYTLHEERDAEGVEPLLHEELSNSYE